MGVYIKGIEMPKSCRKCFIKHGSCPAIRKRIQVLPKNNHICVPYNYRYDDCPLGNVPTPHGKLIDADAVSLEGGPYEYDEWCKWALTQYQDAPTIIEA